MNNRISPFSRLPFSILMIGCLLGALLVSAAGQGAAPEPSAVIDSASSEPALIDIQDGRMTNTTGGQTIPEGTAAAWLARQKSRVSPRDFDLLARAQATLLANIGRPDDVTLVT